MLRYCVFKLLIHFYWKNPHLYPFRKYKYPILTDRSFHAGFKRMDTIKVSNLFTQIAYYRSKISLQYFYNKWTLGNLKLRGSFPSANTQKELGCTTLETVKYGAEDHGEDEAEVSLHAAAEEGNVSTLKSLIERGMDINTRNARSQSPFEHRLLPRKTAFIHETAKKWRHGALRKPNWTCMWTNRQVWRAEWPEERRESANERTRVRRVEQKCANAGGSYEKRYPDAWRRRVA